jgi:hypothetical protein
LSYFSLESGDAWRHIEDIDVWADFREGRTKRERSASRGLRLGGNPRREIRGKLAFPKFG